MGFKIFKLLKKYMFYAFLKKVDNIVLDKTVSETPR